MTGGGGGGKGGGKTARVRAKTGANTLGARSRGDESVGEKPPSDFLELVQGEQTSLHIEEKRVLVEQVAALQQQVAALQGRRLAEGSAEASSDTVAQEEVRRERSTRANAGGGKTARV